VHDRALFDPGHLATSRTSDLIDELLDHELHVRARRMEARTRMPLRPTMGPDDLDG
jgi:hypothetical protein